MKLKGLKYLLLLVIVLVLWFTRKNCDCDKQYPSSANEGGTRGNWRNVSGTWKKMVLDINSSYKKLIGPGYILVNEYADQMTGASFGILSLQCWAGSIDSRVKVVEPFLLTGSAFGYDFSKNWEESQRSLGDIFNLEKWQEQLKKMGLGYSYAVMEQWNEFIKHAPRNLIVVKKQCVNSSSCNDIFYQTVSSFAARNGFRIVRSTQIEDKVYSYENFKSLIYGGLNPRNVVVLFQQWGGLAIKPYKRLYAVFGINRCHRNQYYDFLFDSSKRIVQDRKKYTQKYVSESGEKPQYMGVMLRTEKYIYDVMKARKSPAQKLAILNSCLKAIEEKVSSLQRLHNTIGLFLTVDSRKHGSRGLRNNSAPSFMSNKLLDSFTTKLFQILEPYGNRLTVQEWDASFLEIPSFQDPGYVAQLQKDLAASGKCLVLAGGGSFQRAARIMYLSKHLDSEYCAYNVKCL